MVDKWLKGDPFVNRVRITGTLTTRSPLHIGTGETREIMDGDETCQVSTIVRDHRGKPLIPGSSLRGVMRHWLAQIWQGLHPGREVWPERDGIQEMSQPEQIRHIREAFGWLELLFGTTFNAGKIEVWDGVCMTSAAGDRDELIHWDPDRLTYVDTSTAIDPATGTVMDKLLYKADVVPPGIAFQASITGQNLSDVELGLTLLALQGFNSQIFPIQLGARGGRGYGLMRFELDKVYFLEQAQARDWILDMVQNLGGDDGMAEAGYFALPELSAEAQQALVARAKAALLAEMEVQ